MLPKRSTIAQAFHVLSRYGEGLLRAIKDNSIVSPCPLDPRSIATTNRSPATSLTQDDIHASPHGANRMAYPSNSSSSKQIATAGYLRIRRSLHASRARHAQWFEAMSYRSAPRSVTSPITMLILQKTVRCFRLVIWLYGASPAEWRAPSTTALRPPTQCPV